MNISLPEVVLDKQDPKQDSPVVANRSPQRRAAAELARAAMSLANEDGSGLSEDNNDDLASISDSAQLPTSTKPAAARTSRPRPRVPKSLRYGDDGSFLALKTPRQKADGTYVRPVGRGPEGMKWDAVRGVFVPNARKGINSANTNRALSGRARKASEEDIPNDDSNPYKKPRLSSAERRRSDDKSTKTRPPAASSVPLSPTDGEEGDIPNDDSKPYKKPRLSSSEWRRSDNKLTKTPPPAASSVSSSPTDDEKDNGERHYTRSRGSGRGSSEAESNGYKRNGGRVAVYQERPGTPTPRIINECATILARVDNEAHERALVQDATAILEGYLWPMSFPWNHRSIVPTVKNYPRDIDELPAVANLQDEEYTPFENGDFGYGAFEVGKERRPQPLSDEDKDVEVYHAAARRTAEAGVIELTVIDHKNAIDQFSRLRNRPRDVNRAESDSLASIGAKSTSFLSDGEPTNGKSSGVANGDKRPVASQQKGDQLSGCDAEGSIFQCFQRTVATKNRRLSVARDKVQRLLVSVRVGSVSSRSSVLKPSPPPEREYSVPLLRQAVIPSRKHRGTSNDTRASESEAMKKHKAKNDRLLWTQVDSSGGCISALTGSGVVAFKKPHEVRVGVKLNGQLLVSQTGSSSSPRPVGVNIMSPTIASINEALDLVCGGATVSTKQITSMCMLDIEKLSRKMNAPQPRVVVDARTMPRLECMPLALKSAAVRIVCTSPGKMKATCITELFNASKGKNCSVCWTEDEDVKKCSKCGLLAHTTCCAHGGMMMQSSKGGSHGSLSWMCAICFEKPKISEYTHSRRRSATLPARYQESDVLLGIDLHNSKTSRVEGIKCSLCPHSGGAMSPVGDEGWAHEVCHIWSRSESEVDSSITQAMGICAVCGSRDSGPLIKCIGSGCLVRFHPMCALITAVDDDNRNGGLTEDAHEMDERLCSRFTLDVLQCNESHVPVGFCGLHNPMRDTTLYGAYPGGFGSAMRVPAYRTGKPRIHIQQKREAAGNEKFNSRDALVGPQT